MALWFLADLPSQFHDGQLSPVLLVTSLEGLLVTNTLLVLLAACVDADAQPRFRTAMLALAAFGAAIVGLVVEHATLLAFPPWIPPLPPNIVIWANFGTQLSMCIIAVYAYDFRARAKRRAAALRDLRRRRAVAEKQAAEARLRAMQARVDPQWLFETLAAVDRLQETSPAIGGRLLDDLIGYLRAALPDARDASSTLGRELDLARAWLDIERVLRRQGLDYRVEMEDELRAEPLPPLILVPLIEAALPAERDGAQEASMTIAVGSGPSSVRIRIERADPAGTALPADDSDLTELRVRLHALYGDAARLTCANESGGAHSVTLEIPDGEPESADR